MYKSLTILGIAATLAMPAAAFAGIDLSLNLGLGGRAYLPPPAVVYEAQPTEVYVAPPPTVVYEQPTYVYTPPTVVYSGPSVVYRNYYGPYDGGYRNGYRY